MSTNVYMKQFGREIWKIRTVTWDNNLFNIYIIMSVCPCDVHFAFNTLQRLQVLKNLFKIGTKMLSNIIYELPLTISLETFVCIKNNITILFIVHSWSNTMWQKKHIWLIILGAEKWNFQLLTSFHSHQPHFLSNRFYVC